MTEQEFKILEFQSENPEDLIGKLLFKLIVEKEQENSQMKSDCEKETARHTVNMEKHDQNKKEQKIFIIQAVEQIKQAIGDKKLDFSDISQVLEGVSSSNIDLREGFNKLSSEYPKIAESISKLAVAIQESKPDGIDFSSLSNANSKGFSEMAKSIVLLTEELKKKKPSENIQLSGPIEISKPVWYKPFIFSWEPLKEIIEKIKAHTFSVKIVNPETKESVFDTSGFAKKIGEVVGKTVEDAIKKIPRTGGGGGNPFAFGKEGAIKVESEGMASEQTLLEVKNAIENQTLAVGGATEAKQDAIIDEISNKDLMLTIRNLMQLIANPSYVDKSANAIRNQVQSGTVTTVTTVGGLTNIDGYQGKLQIINQNISAWSQVVRSRIS